MARPAEYKVRIEFLDDGSLKNRRVERYAIFLADDLEVPAAWLLSDNKPAGTPINYTYKRRVDEDGNFRRRLAELRAEKEDLMSRAKTDPFAPLIWQANQSYRLAVAAGDQKEMRSCAELGMKLVEKSLLASGASPRMDQIPASRGPGRPANEPQVSMEPPSEFKARLLAMKMVPPGSEAGDAA